MRFKFKPSFPERLKVSLDSEQKKHLADLLKDSANVFLASLVVGQLIIEEVKYGLALFGFIIYIGLIAYTLSLRKKGTSWKKKT